MWKYLYRNASIPARTPKREPGANPGCPADVRLYLQYCADQRLATLGLPKRYQSKNRFAFMDLQDVQEVTNFFERRVSAYQVGVPGEVSLDASF